MWFIRSLSTFRHDSPPAVDQSIHGMSEVRPEMIGGRQSATQAKRPK